MEIKFLSFTVKVLGSNFVKFKILLQHPNLLMNLFVISLQTNQKAHNISNV